MAHQSSWTAKAYLLLHKGKFEELYSFLEGNQFSSSYHGRLQEYWVEGHYREQDESQGR